MLLNNKIKQAGQLSILAMEISISSLPIWILFRLEYSQTLIGLHADWALDPLSDQSFLTKAS